MSEEGVKRHIPLDELERAGLAGEFVLASELPDEFVGTLEDAYIATDGRGREGLYVTIRLEDGRVTRQKFTKSMWPMFAKFLRKAGVAEVNAAVGMKFKWERMPVGRGYPRHFPTEVRKK